MDMLSLGVVMRADDDLMLIEIQAFDHVIRGGAHLVVGRLFELMPAEDQVVIRLLDTIVQS
ncbi:hypothetical protein RV420_120002 [Roseovarius sp. EC-SD190]|nr:hypothetical protein RV420_120002 [Roseovarius sp. EC-SD190]